MPGITHGTLFAYRKGGCRCGPCTAANSTQVATERTRRYRRTAANGGVAPVTRHNAATRANWGCGCGDCKTSNAAAERTRRATVHERTAHGQAPSA